MTRRIDSPDTDADRELRACLDQHPTSNFIMISGAGSGKTTSLVKALAHLNRTRGASLRKRGQQIACITFTEIAVGEIQKDAGDTKLFHISTIHSFLWTVVRAFQADIRDWAAGRIGQRIAEAQEHLNRPRTRATTITRLNEDIARLTAQLAHLPLVKKFTYGTGSNYSEGILGHEDVLRIGPALIEQYLMMRRVIAQRFPYVFVDESQDTDPEFIAALKRIAALPDTNFVVGFFGDPMQKIYLSGAGSITPEADWEPITKRENFRCPLSVIDVINAIRAEDDGLEQVPAPRQGSEGLIPVPQGTAKLFILPNNADRNEKLTEVRQWMSTNSGDPLWIADDDESHVRMLVLVHRIAANRLGFPALYAALNDNGSNSLREGLLEGNAWVLRPFLEHLLPLVDAENSGRSFEVMKILRANCPLLSKERLVGADVAEVLARIQENLGALVTMLRPDSTATIGEILLFVRTREIAKLDDRYMSFLGDAVQPTDAETEDEENADDEADDTTVLAFLAVPACQLWGYHTYIKDQSPFSTHQGIKGAEFERVLVILDDEESAFRQFSYGKYWGTEPPSTTDQGHIAAGEESVIDRTRRLFYVCCSRALKHLAVLFYVNDTARARAIVETKAIFPAEDIHVL